MKINSVGIEAYRQLGGNAQVNRHSQSGKTESALKSGRVEIPIQDNRVSSKLGVKLKEGSFLDRLTPEEKQALEMLFSKYGAGGVNGSSDSLKPGTFVDFKA